VKLSSLTVPDAEAQQKWAAIPLPLGYIAPDMEDKYIRSDKQLHPGSCGWLIKQLLSWKILSLVPTSQATVVGANWGEQFTGRSGW